MLFYVYGKHVIVMGDDPLDSLYTGIKRNRMYIINVALIYASVYIISGLSKTKTHTETQSLVLFSKIYNSVHKFIKKI